MTTTSAATAAQLDQLRLRIHQAALEPDLWRTTLASLTRLVRARSSHLTILDRATLALSFLGADDAASGARPDGYGPWQEGDASRVLTNVAVNDRRLWSAVTARRAPRDARFGAPERRILDALTPHLASAVAVHVRLAGLAERLRATEAALDRLPLGICLLDRAGRIEHRNAAAQAMLAAKDGLAERAGRLCATAATDCRQLALRIKAALAMALGDSAAMGGTLLIGRPSLRRPYSVLVAPLSPARDATGGVIGESRPCAIVLLTDLEEERSYPAALLAQRYGLTAAEARLAGEILAGSSLQQAAERFGVAIGTVRNQLKQVFLKTEVNRQAELVRLLANDLAARAAPLVPCWSGCRPVEEARAAVPRAHAAAAGRPSPLCS
jgi:DNA-binding CsgD family transcriptional regulator